MYLFCRQYLHFDVLTSWRETEGPGKKAKYEVPPSRHFVSSSFRGAKAEQYEKFPEMFTCCCLHIALNCSLYLRTIFLAFRGEQISPVTRASSSICIFLSQHIFLIISIDSLRTIIDEVLKRLICSNLSDRMLVWWCKTIYHSFVIMFHQKVRKEKLHSSLDLINLVALFYLQFPLISCCHYGVCVRWELFIRLPLFTLSPVFLRSLASCQKWNLISHNDNVTIIRQLMRWWCEWIKRFLSLAFWIDISISRGWRLLTRGWSVSWQHHKEFENHSSRHYSLSSGNYRLSPPEPNSFISVSHKLRKTTGRTKKINFSKIYVGCLFRNIC